MALSFDGISTTKSSQSLDERSLYGSYLLTEPFGRSPLPSEFRSTDFDRLLEILQKSVGHFAKRGRGRTVERLRLEIARLSVQNNDKASALQVLIPLWSDLSWRREGWWELVAALNWILRDCAREVGDEKTLVAVEWELLFNCE